MSTIIQKSRCKQIIPHTPNFVERVEYDLQEEGVYNVNFTLKFPENWDFLNNRIYKALPNSIIIEALGQVAMIFFKDINEDGLPATHLITTIKNHKPFYDFSKNVLGEYNIKMMKDVRGGKLGRIYNCILKDNMEMFFSLKNSTFILIK